MIKEINYKTTYPIRHAVMWPDKPMAYIELKDDPTGFHYGYFHEGILVAVISIFIKDNKAQFRKFATLVNYQRKGIGRKLLNYALESLKDVETIWCNARLEKTSYYESFNMKKTDQIFEKGGKSYVIMCKNKFD